MAAGNIAVNVFARTAKFQAGMTRATTSLKIFRTAAITTVGTMKTLTGAFAPLAGIAGFASIVRGAESMNQKLNAVAAVAGGLSSGEMEQLKAAAIDVGRVTKFSGSEAAEGLRFLKAGGLSTAAAIEALPVSAKFAQASLMGLGDATDRLIVATSAMGLESANAAEQMASMKRVANVLAKGSTLAATTVSDISDALNVAASSAKLSGMSLEETVSSIIALQKRGFTAVRAGDTLRQMLDFTARAATENADAWKSMGIRVVDVNDQFRGISAVMADMNRIMANEGFTGLQRRMDDLGLPQKAQKGFKAILEASEEIEGFTAATLDAGRAVEDMADRQLTPFQRGWANLKAAIEGVSDPVFTPMIDGLGRAFGSMGDKLRDFGKTWGLRWELTKVSGLVALDSLKAGAIASFNALVKAGAFALQNMPAIFRDLRALGVASFEALGVAAGRTWDLIAAGVRTLGQRLMESFKGIGRGAVGFGEAISQAIKAGARLEDPAAAFQTAFAASLGQASMGGGSIFEGLKGEAAGIADKVGMTFDAALKREGFGKALPELARVAGDEWSETFADRVDKGLLKRRADLLKALAGGEEGAATGRGFFGSFIERVANMSRVAFATSLGQAAFGTDGGQGDPMGGGMEPPRGGPTGALLAGSSEAFSEIQRFMRESTVPDKDPAKEAVKQREETNRILEDIRRYSEQLAAAGASEVVVDF